MYLDCVFDRIERLDGASGFIIGPLVALMVRVQDQNIFLSLARAVPDINNMTSSTKAVIARKTPLGTDLPEENSFSLNVDVRTAATVAAAAEKETWRIYQGG